MRDSDIVDRLRQIDTLQARLSDIINDIADSDHPQAAAIAGALWEQCWFAASAEHVAVDYLDKKRWSLQKYERGQHGRIISRQMARKQGFDTVD